jgi:hypothetical protein
MPFISFADGTEVVAGLAVTKEGDINRYDLTGYFQDWDAVNDRRQAKVRAPALLWCSRSRPDNHSASHRTYHKIPRSAGARGSPQKFEGMRAIHCPEWHLSPSCLASGP